MRIDLPLCSFKDCRHNFDGNCRSEERKEKCEFDVYKKAFEEQPKIGGWIPCSERLPKEHDSMFAKFKGTENWGSAMFEKVSDDVNVTVEFENGARKTKTLHTVDGKWNGGQRGVKFKVVAWQPLPEAYHG